MQHSNTHNTLDLRSASLNEMKLSAGPSMLFHGVESSQMPTQGYFKYMPSGPSTPGVLDPVSECNPYKAFTSRKGNLKISIPLYRAQIRNQDEVYFKRQTSPLYLKVRATLKLAALC